eukprot:2602085-Pyramimonas_sp.AAC.1
MTPPSARKHTGLEYNVWSSRHMSPLIPQRGKRVHIHLRLNDGEAAAMSMEAKIGTRASAPSDALSLRASASTRT